MFDFELTFGHYVKNPSLLPILHDSITTWVGAPQLKKLCSKLRSLDLEERWIYLLCFG